MRTGIDQISTVIQKKLKGRRIGLLCHPASVNSKLQHILNILQPSPSIFVRTLFGPEHGIWGVAQDMEPVEGTKDLVTGLPVHSLYGSTLESLKPNGKMLDKLEAVVCDLQDVGSRYYTFAYSIAFMMQACRDAGIPVYVLDRPNPINGTDVEGGTIEKGFESFVGLYPIANRHGMTIGELACLFNEAFEIWADLTVVRMRGWKRKNYFEETKLPWVLPSPNMPTPETALVYPGMCLIEATEISEGRGTTRPFEVIGAPFLDPFRLAKRLGEFKLRGVFFRPLFFKPTFHKFAGQACGGVQLHVTDRKAFKSYLTGLAVLKAVHDLSPENFRWREKPYEFVGDIPAIDLLTGSDRFRKKLEAGKSWKEIREDSERGKSEFLKLRKNFLLY
jgi:uncharacterized protein YbbC (DUF1343 family)